MRSLKFRIIAVYEVSKSKDFKIARVDNIKIKRKIYWNIVEALRKITYHPKKYKVSPVKKIWIPEINNKKKLIGIPNIIDKALQQLLYLILEPLVELTSDFNSFGFRKYRNAKIAIGVLRGLLKTMNKNYIKIPSQKQREKNVSSILHEDKWILDADIENFFSNIHNKYLLNNLFLPSVGEFLVKSVLYSGIIDKLIFINSIDNILQGGVFSTILINFSLNGLEKVVYKSIHYLIKSKSRCIVVKGQNASYFFYLDIVRYADNFVVLCRNKYILETLVLPNLRLFLKERGLQLSQKKIKLFRLKDGIKLKFLGYIFHYENKWKIKNKIMYSNYSGSKHIALYPDKFYVNIII